MTREEMAARRANIARHVERGRRPADVARLFDITPQRVGQIVDRVRRDAQRERCRSGVHGERYRDTAMIWQDDGVSGVEVVRCLDCGARVE